MPERPNVPAPGESFRRDFSATVETERDPSEGKRRSIFQFTTGGEARDGMVLEPDGLDVSGFLRNPVVLFQHGYDGQRGALPIGKASDVRQTENGWTASVEWANDEFSRAIADMVRDGFLSAVSIGWRTLDAGWKTRGGRETYVINRAEMMEFSVVSVPADADALVLERADAALTAELARLRAQVQALEARLAPDEPKAEPEPQAEPEQRAATPEDVLAALARIAPEIDQNINRALGRA